MKNTPLRFVLVLAASLLSPGCASIFMSGHDDLKVVTEPPGALARVGERFVVTPGVIKVPRDAKPVVVLVEKQGYQDVEIPIGRTRSGAVWTNVVGVSAGAALTAFASIFCAFGDCEGKQYIPLGVGAAATGGGLALDLSTNRTLVLARDEIVLRLEPVRLAKAQEGEPR